MADTDQEKPLVLPVIPEQGPGINFEVTADQKIGVAKSGIASDADLVEIHGLKHTLLEALDDLSAATKSSNAFKSLNTAAGRYAQELAEEHPSIDILYGRGLRCEGSVSRLRELVAKGELPEADLSIAEALDTVVALNGTVILSTARGRELIARSTEYDRTQLEFEILKTELEKLADTVQSSRNLFTQEAKEATWESIEDAGKGRHPNRTSNWAELTTGNLLSLLGKTALNLGAGAVVLSEPGQILMHTASPIVDQIWYFLLQNQGNIREIAAIGGQHFQHMNSLINVLARFENPQALAEYYSSNKIVDQSDSETSSYDLEVAISMILQGKNLPEA